MVTVRVGGTGERKVPYSEVEEKEKWQDRVLSNDLAEALPVGVVVTAALTMCATFAIFYATGQTTRKICEKTTIGCERIDEWQHIPTISFTWVAWPGYIVAVAGMLTSCALLLISTEVVNHTLELQRRRLGIVPNFQLGGCCCCLSITGIIGACRVMSYLVCICLATCVCCSLRLNAAVHGISASLLFFLGIILIFLQQQAQVSLFGVAMQEDSTSWVSAANSAMQFKKVAVCMYILSFIGFSVAVSLRKSRVEPYSASLEYAVVVCLALGISSYARDIRLHKLFFGDSKSRVAFVDSNCEKEVPQAEAPDDRLLEEFPSESRSKTIDVDY
ncbi:hypothetical protein AAMO2058_000484200 [Amorphochlora amoebiformis]